jgi:xanthine dehydrogenase accessory factor
MAISSAGDVEGSVSGGCVEAAVFEAARGVIDRHAPRLLRFGVTDEQAWAVGLSCGGEIEVFVELLAGPGASPGIHRTLIEALDAERPVVLVTGLDGTVTGRHLLFEPGGASQGGLGSADLDTAARREAARLLPGFRCDRVSLADGDAGLFVECFGPRPTVVIVGAVHVAIPLVTFAKTLGFRTVVVDPRPVFASPERFAHADELRVEWPQDALPATRFNESTFLVVLSHDLRIDLPALAHGLRHPIPYIGAMGSRTTQKGRVAALEAEGFTANDIGRIHTPIGLDLGGRRAEELALAIIAEIVAVSQGVDTRAWSAAAMST